MASSPSTLSSPLDSTNRRRFERFSLPPMYTPVSVRYMENEKFTLDGHAYDISEGGCQFELDRAIEPGALIALQITLPLGLQADDIGPGRSVFVFSRVVWIYDEEAGPVRMAASFEHFARAGDKERLLRQITTGRLSRVA